MADKKISELTAITGANTAATDAFVMVDTSTGETKKITREELNNAIEQDVLSTVDINGGTIDGTTIGGTTAAAGSFTTVDATGNITVAGTVDGRDVATDGTKLDGIEASATADQTGAEIATALNGETISSLTALTTTGAVIVGGDLTVNGTTTTINSTTLTVDDKNIELASGAADAAAANGAGITIDGASATFNYASTGDKWTFNKTIDVTGDVIASGDLTVDTDTLHVDSANNRVGIGTASPVAAMQIKTQTNGNAAFQNSTSVSGGVKINAFNDAANASVPFELDGSTLQFNIAATEKMRLDSSGHFLVSKTVTDLGTAGHTLGSDGYVYHTRAGDIQFLNRTGSDGVHTRYYRDGADKGNIGVYSDKLQIGQGNANVQFSNADDAIIPTNGNGTVNDNAIDLGTSSARFNDLYLGGAAYVAGNTVWHAGNDGSGSGLDADTLDGVQGSSYLRSDATDTTTGYFSVDNHFRVVNNGVSGQGDNNTHFNYNDTGINYIRGTNTYFSSPAEFANSVTIDRQSPVLQFEADANYSSYVRFSNGSTLQDGEIQYAPAVDTMYFRTGNTANRMSIDGSGNVVAAGNVTAYSDERLKDNIETLDGSKVYEMRGVSFTKDGEAGSGVIAQELQKIAPELVHEKDEYLTVAYGNVVGYLIEAVKDLKAEIEELKNASAK